MLMYLFLRGGNSWVEPEQEGVLELAKHMLEANKVVAAICASSIGLARKGLLNDTEQTSKQTIISHY